FLGTLAKVKARQGHLAAKRLTADCRAQLLAEGRAAKRPLLLLDYDGTLIPIASEPGLAEPDPELLELLRRLSQRFEGRVFVISGRDRHTLARWVGDTGVGLIAEHGVWLREGRGDFQLTKPLTTEWKEQVAPLLAAYVAQVGGSLVEEKDFSLAWHYRRADPELAAQRAKELVDELTQFIANL